MSTIKDTLQTTIAAVVILAVIFALGQLTGCTSDPENTWPESAEFSQLQTGQDRFSQHNTNVPGVYIIVDHSSGTEYLYAPKNGGLCPLYDKDGTPARVLEAGE